MKCIEFGCNEEGNHKIRTLDMAEGALRIPARHANALGWKLVASFTSAMNI